MAKKMIGRAIFSPCRTYRYRLERPAPEGREGPKLAFIMANPSTADEKNDDQTIRMVRLFGRRHGYGEILIGNIFAYRSRNITALGTASDPVGPDNDTHLKRIMQEADRCYAAWGAESKFPIELRGRWRQVADMAEALSCKLFCLDHLVGDHPRHPQILKYTDPDLAWRRPA